MAAWTLCKCGNGYICPFCKILVIVFLSLIGVFTICLIRYIIRKSQEPGDKCSERKSCGS